MRSLYSTDKVRKGEAPLFQYWYRVASGNYPSLIRGFGKLMLKFTRFFYHCEISADNKIGPGLYIGHPYGITINPAAILGCNINIHKGVTIGRENRGSRDGAPVIGDSVWIGVNATIVGKITVGNDVMIAPNAFVNCDIPDHSVVFGNPCVIKHRDNATAGYINHKV
jgi:serine O-acetyltransferase